MKVSRERVNYGSWEDTTGEIVGVIGGNLVKLEVVKTYDFGNYETAMRFEAHRQDYINSNRWRDVHIDSSPIFEVSGHQPRVLVQNKGTVRPCCLDISWFWICSFFLLSWPYRMWFEFISDTKSIVLRKVIYA